MNLYKAPNYAEITNRMKIFLAGSIDMGAARDWQAELIDNLSDLDVDIFNPRRDDWDSSWVQSIDNPQFKEQVTWELDHLDRADTILVVFTAESMAPITLLELGLYAKSGKCVVLCPMEFWRRGNVEIVCAAYGIPIFHETEPFTKFVRDEIKSEIFLNSH
jgi:hypothetical protein